MLFIPLPPIAGVNRRSIVKFFVELAPWDIPLTRGVSKLHSQEKSDARLCESVGTEPGSFRTSAFTPRPDSALAISVAFRKRRAPQEDDWFAENGLERIPQVESLAHKVSKVRMRY